jgi:protein EFR3
MSFPIPVKGSSSQDLLQLVLSAFSSDTIIEEVPVKDGIQESFQETMKSEAMAGAENGYSRQSPGSPYLDAFHLTAFDEVWNPACICVFVSITFYVSEYPTDVSYIILMPYHNLKLMKLNSNQIVLLLSSIWSQAFLGDNAPANFEAMGHTYSIALLCSIAKVSTK